MHDAADLFRIFAENILAHPEEGRARALKAVQCVNGDTDAARLLMRVTCAMARADGSYSRPGMTQIRRIAKTLGQCDLELGDEAAVAALAGAERPYFITVGNHKGGTGKSTTAMHLAVGLMIQRHRVGCIDLDGQQGTLSHYLANRRETQHSSGRNLPMPCLQRIEPATGRDREAAALTAVQSSQLCAERSPGAAVCDYWLALALGVQARERRSTAHDALPRMVELLERVVAERPDLEHAGPHRVLAARLGRAAQCWA